MGNALNPEFENWNRTSVDYCMGFLLCRFDIIEYQRTQIAKPISIELYNFLSTKMEKFLFWYKNNKPNNYLPSSGLSKMYSYELIYKVFNMNKQNKNLKKIVKLWNRRTDSINNDFTKNKEKYKNESNKLFRFEINELPSIPNDPMIMRF